MDHSHLVSNEAICDSEGFSTRIQLSQEDEVHSSPLCIPTSHPEHTTTTKKRKCKSKKNQNLRTRKTNEDVEQVASLRTFSQASIEGASTDVDCITDLYSTGRVRSGTSIDEQVICQVNEGLNLPSVMNRSYGTETQPEPSEVDSKIRNETHGLIVYNIPEILEGTPSDQRCL